jgi:asparagine synthase (glutamine-hydrolysing)
MCGILVNISEEEIREDHPALEIIRHRGPDDYGAASFDLGKFKLSFGHRRLSIIDLSERGKQPMSLQDGNYWITYNGEIYNYLEIKVLLEKDGFVFKSDSDTEVLLTAYCKWGRDCLEKFNGMFSFCIYDKSKNKIFAARDRLGIKPLYYCNSPSGFRLVSEIKQLTAFDDFKRDANKEKLYHFLNSGDFDFDSETIWKNVLEVPPGHILEIKLDNWKPGDNIIPQKWYELPFGETLDISFDEAVEEFREKLLQSVKFRLRADVPLGFLLSGGLDSSTLVGLAHNVPRNKNAHLRTYSSCYDDKSIDERKFINAMVEFTGADACMHYPKPEDISENLDKVIWHNDIPILHGSPVPHWLIYKHIKDENDSRIVILEGQGADEILCGYGDFYWAFFYEQLKSGSLGSLFHQFTTFQRRHHEKWKIIIRKYLRLRNLEKIKYPANEMLNLDCLLGAAFSVPPIAVRREERSVTDLHKNRLTILRYILHNVDRNSMSQSRETRVPFLDHNLVEFCLKLPSSYKINEGLTKRVLRESVKDTLPDVIYKRHDKQGYSSPVKKWAMEELKDFFAENMEQAKDLPFVNKKNFMESYDRFVKNGGFFDPVWWRIIATQKWIKMFKANI